MITDGYEVDEHIFIIRLEGNPPNVLNSYKADYLGAISISKGNGSFIELILVFFYLRFGKRQIRVVIPANK